MSRLTVAITGSTGYVGSALAEHFRAAGWQVAEMRRTSAGRSGREIRFELANGCDATELAGIDALVHCAWDLAPRTWREIHRVNVEGSAKLLRAAQQAGVERTVVISSLSAFAGCVALYGRAKLEIEKEARQIGAAIVRPGLVWGGGTAGLVGALERVTARLPVIPVVGTGRPALFTTHVHDLCELIGALLAREIDHGSTPVFCAHDEPKSLRSVVEELAAVRGRRPVILSVPTSLVSVGLRCLDLLGVRSAFRSDSLRSLMSLDPERTRQETVSEAHRFRPFSPASSTWVR